MPHSKRNRVLPLSTAVLALGLSLATGAFAEDTESVEAKIARAITAAPSDITENATIEDVDGTVLREGSNDWTCIPGIPLLPGDEHPMCNDAIWTRWLKAAQAGESFSTDVVGFSYMLAGDALVNNADPTATDPNDGGLWVQDGPHIMMLMPNAEMMAHLPRDPYAGGAYVMWDKTPMAHVMLPFEAKVKD